MRDQHPLRPDRLYYALVWWLFWNREAKMGLLWLLRFHRRPHAWERWANKKILRYSMKQERKKEKTR